MPRRPARARAAGRRTRLAVGQHDQPVGVAVGLLDVVGGVEDGGALPGEAEDELPEALALARIERRARLVEQQHLRLGEQADGDVDALTVAARQRAHLIAGAITQAGQVEHPLDGLAQVLAALEAREQA